MSSDTANQHINIAPDILLNEAIKSLGDQPDRDIDLLAILKNHIVNLEPTAAAVDEALAEIDSLITRRVEEANNEKSDLNQET